MSVRLHVEFKAISKEKTRVIDEIFINRKSAEEYIEQLKFHGWTIVNSKIEDC